MPSLFRFRRAGGPLDFAVGMCGVRMGERLLAVGGGSPDLVAAVASKVGLTGQATAIVANPDEQTRIEAAAADAGVLVDVVVAPTLGWPADLTGFDVALVDGNGLLAAADAERLARLDAARHAVRPGGRIVAVYRRPRTLAQRLGLGAAGTGGPEAASLQAVLSAAAFVPVRFLAEREGFTFVEAFRPRT